MAKGDFNSTFQQATDNTPPQFGLSSKNLGLKNKENRRVLLGYALRYGSPIIGLLVSFISGPCACIVLPLAAIGVLLAERAGTKILRESKGNKMKGIPKHVEGMRKLWDETKLQQIKKKGKKPFEEFKGHYNEFIKMSCNKRWQKRLLMRKNNRIENIGSKAFHVQAVYRDKPVGKILNGTRKFGRRIPILRIPIVAFTWLAQGFVTLLYYGKAQRILKAAMKK